MREFLIDFLKFIGDFLWIWGLCLGFGKLVFYLK